jgi:hypothetical protein
MAQVLKHRTEITNKEIISDLEKYKNNKVSNIDNVLAMLTLDYFVVVYLGKEIREGGIGIYGI